MVSETVPHWLKRRPLPFLRHCMKRLPEVTMLERHHVVEVSDGLFHVFSHTSDDRYEVLICTDRPDVLVPSCQCRDWKKTGLPCKHLIAVLSFYPIAWKNVPDHYINSWLFRIDLDLNREADANCVGNEQNSEDQAYHSSASSSRGVERQNTFVSCSTEMRATFPANSIGVQTDSSFPPSSNTEDPCILTSGVHASTSSTSPGKTDDDSPGLNRLQFRVRLLLKSLCDLSYNIVDVQLLKDASVSISAVRDSFRAVVPRSSFGGFPLRRDGRTGPQLPVRSGLLKRLHSRRTKLRLKKKLGKRMRLNGKSLSNVLCFI